MPFQKGHKSYLTPESIEKISAARKGKPTWNKGKKGIWTTEQLAHFSKIRIGHLNPFFGKKHTPKSLAKMSKARKVLPSTFKGHAHSLESRQKMSEVRKTKRGPNANNWKGGLTPLKLIIRHSDAYKTWRTTIFQRDAFICQLCGLSKSGKMEVDHYPTRFSDIMYQQGIDSLDKALACQQLWDTNNGRTLCKDCHLAVTHKKYVAEPC